MLLFPNLLFLSLHNGRLFEKGAGPSILLQHLHATFTSTFDSSTEPQWHPPTPGVRQSNIGLRRNVHVHNAPTHEQMRVRRSDLTLGHLAGTCSSCLQKRDSSDGRGASLCRIWLSLLLFCRFRMNVKTSSTTIMCATQGDLWELHIPETQNVTHSPEFPSGVPLVAKLELLYIRVTSLRLHSGKLCDYSYWHRGPNLLQSSATLRHLKTALRNRRWMQNEQ